MYWIKITSGSTVRVQCKAVHVRVRVRVQLLYNVVRAAIKKHHTVCYCTCSTKVLSKVVVLSYFRTFVRISTFVLKLSYNYVVLSYLRSILFLSSYGSTKVRKYNYSRKYHTSVRVLHSVHFAGFTVSRGYGGHTTVHVRCTRTVQ